MTKTINDIIADPDLRENLERRFLSKVRVKGPGDCWPWIATAVTAFGYGRMTAGRGVNLKAHRVSYALFCGPIPDGLSVLHSCDNPRCCNPRHLFVGTQLDNIDDMQRKGRGSDPPAHLGESHHNTKFGEAEARRIISDSRVARVVAEEFGVSEKTVYRLRRGETWKGLRR